VNPSTVDITFFVPCYNEAPHVASTFEMIKRLMQRRSLTYEIAAVDDGSSDGTSQVVEAYCKEHPDQPIVFHRNPVNLGLGRNYFLWAKRSRGRHYMLINGDNDTSIDDFALILDHLGKADMIVPYVANQHDRPSHRNLISRGFNLAVSLVSGHRLRYYNGPVLHLRENVVRFEPKASGFAYQAEILCRALNEGCSHVEVPLYYVKKEQDSSSGFRLHNIASVLKSLTRIFVKTLQYRLFKPALKTQSQ